MAADVVYEAYTTFDGDMVDMIAFKRFGSSSGTAEAILAANPGLANRGPRLPAGLVLQIPVPVQKDRRQGVNLWS